MTLGGVVAQMHGQMKSSILSQWDSCAHHENISGMLNDTYGRVIFFYLFLHTGLPRQRKAFSIDYSQ